MWADNILVCLGEFLRALHEDNLFIYLFIFWYLFSSVEATLQRKTSTFRALHLYDLKSCSIIVLVNVGWYVLPIYYFNNFLAFQKWPTLHLSIYYYINGETQINHRWGRFLR